MLEFPSEKVRVTKYACDARKIARVVVADGTREEPFYVFSLDEMHRRVDHFRRKLARVDIFFAVKSNHHQATLKCAAALGLGFDCASKEEIERVIAVGVPPQRVIFAQPAKIPSHLRRAEELGVNLVTFDGEEEMLKIKKLAPSSRLVLRIRCDAKVSDLPLGDKFGCDAVNEAPRLLALAAEWDLNVVGISFHVGCECQEPEAFDRAIAWSRALFDFSIKLGRPMSLLDLGGGFPVGDLTKFDEISEVISDSLSRHFPSEDEVSVIAEPGRYIVDDAFTLFCYVHSERKVHSSSTGKDHTMLYINESVFNSFLLVMPPYNYSIPVQCIEDQTSDGPTKECIIWGASCSSVDLIAPKLLLPEHVRSGSWLAFLGMGAYSLSCSTTFNGFRCAAVLPVISEELCESLRGNSPYTDEDFIHSDIFEGPATPYPIILPESNKLSSS